MAEAVYIIVLFGGGASVQHLKQRCRNAVGLVLNIGMNPVTSRTPNILEREPKLSYFSILG